MSTSSLSSAVPPHPTAFRIGVVTISDRASAGIYEDRSGPAIVEVLSRWLATPWEPVVRVIADEQDQIEAALRELADTERCALIVTTGGTGPAPRDVTPEATAAVCDRLLPGFGEQMRAVSVKTVPTAILSRQIAGTRGGSLIINLPGKPAAIEECLGAVWAALPYCIELLGGPRLSSSALSPVPFRPLNA
jgi:molybdopterin adenylyltransferase